MTAHTDLEAQKAWRLLQRMGLDGWVVVECPRCKGQWHAPCRGCGGAGAVRVRVQLLREFTPATDAELDQAEERAAEISRASASSVLQGWTGPLVFSDGSVGQATPDDVHDPAPMVISRNVAEGVQHGVDNGYTRIWDSVTVIPDPE